jgi:hypothetical protein
VDKEIQEERSMLIEAEQNQSHLFDHAIITLSSGAFGLSLAFMKNSVQKIDPNTYGILISAWIAFGLSMSSTITSFLTSQYACRRARVLLEENKDDTNDQPRTENMPAFITQLLNILALILFISGAVFLTIFSIFNL